MLYLINYFFAPSFIMQRYGFSDHNSRYPYIADYWYIDLILTIITLPGNLGTLAAEAMNE